MAYTLHADEMIVAGSKMFILINAKKLLSLQVLFKFIFGLRKSVSSVFISVVRNEQEFSKGRGPNTPIKGAGIRFLPTSFRLPLWIFPPVCNVPRPFPAALTYGSHRAGPATPVHIRSHDGRYSLSFCQGLCNVA